MSVAQEQASDLADRLIGPDPVLGQLAEQEVRTEGADALRWLLELLGRDRWDSVPRAARLVGESGEAALEPLVQLLADEARSANATAAFRFLRTPAAERPLSGLLKDRPGRYVVRAAGEYGHAMLAPELFAFAQRAGFDSGAFEDALEALELMLLAQSDPRQGGAVLHELERLVVETKGIIRPRGHPAWHVHRWDMGWVEPVLASLDEPMSPHAWWVQRMAQWLGLARVMRAVPALGRLAADARQGIDARIGALEALAEIAAPGALEAVARAAAVTTGLGEDDQRRYVAAVDAAAVRLAGQAEDPAALARETLARATAANDGITRAHALRSLGRHGAPSDTSLVEPSLSDADWLVRGAAAVAFARLGGGSSMRRLEAAHREAGHATERLETAAALSILDPDGYRDELHERLCDRDTVLPWALQTTIKESILDGLAAGGTEDGRAAAWAEVLHMPRPPSPPTPPDLGTSSVASEAEHQPPDSEASGGRPPAQPDEVTGEDKLGREKLVSVLFSMLKDQEQGTPFTFGLFGGWGEGKSSVMEQLRKRLTADEQKPRFAIAEFNAWEYEKTDSAAAGLLQEAVRGLTGGRRLRRIEIAARYAWARHRWKVVKDLMVLIVGLALAAIAAISGQLGKPLATVLFGTGVASVLSVLGAVAARLYRNPAAAQLFTRFHLPDYSKQLGLLPAMRDDLEKLWEQTQKTGVERLLIIVDDLDRCSGEAITATLDAVRLVMNLDDVIVILALDERILLSAVAREYEKLTSTERTADAIARDFLAKIVQLPIRLEPAASLERYIAEGLFPEEEKRTGDRAGAGPPRPSANGSEPSRGGAAPPEGPEPGPEYQGTEASEGAYHTAEVDAANPLLFREAMRETPDERQAFADFAEAAGIKNPRLLRRIRNTYRFLKAMWIPGLEWRKLMAMLFWQEVLYALPAEKFRARRGESMRSECSNEPMPAALVSKMAQAFVDDDEPATYRRAVSLALLPRLDAEA